MKKISMKILLTCCLTCAVAAANGFSFPPKHKPGKPGHHGAPFDGGLSLLIAAGVAYGAKKAYNRHNAEKK